MLLPLQARNMLTTPQSGDTLLPLQAHDTLSTLQALASGGTCIILVMHSMQKPSKTLARAMACLRNISSTS